MLPNYPIVSVSPRTPYWKSTGSTINGFQQPPPQKKSKLRRKLYKESRKSHTNQAKQRKIIKQLACLNFVGAWNYKLLFTYCN